MIFVWVNKRNWKTPGPIVNVAVHNAASFSALGYETHFCIGAGEHSDTEKDLKDFYGIKPPDSLKIHRVPRLQVGASHYSVSVFTYAFKLIKSLSRRNQVVVFTRESSFLIPLSWFCRNSNISGYYELHDFYANLSWVTEKKGGHYREKLYEHLFLPRINGLLCITRSQQELYRNLFPAIPSCAFPLGTKPVRNTQPTEERRKQRTLMYVGHMHKDKGIDFLIRASIKLAISGIKTLFWGGKEKEASYYQEKVQQLGVANAVKFVPFQPPKKMHRALAEHASLGVVMLQDTYYNRYLTCPIKALDFLSHGIPVVGSDIPSVREVLDYAGTYVRADDLDGFIRSVESLLNDSEQYKKMAALTRQRSEEITWKNRARTIVDFVQHNR